MQRKDIVSIDRREHRELRTRLDAVTTGSPARTLAISSSSSQSLRSKLRPHGLHLRSIAAIRLPTSIPSSTIARRAPVRRRRPSDDQLSPRLKCEERRTKFAGADSSAIRNSSRRSAKPAATSPVSTRAIPRHLEHHGEVDLGTELADDREGALDTEASRERRHPVRGDTRVNTLERLAAGGALLQDAERLPSSSSLPSRLASNPRDRERWARASASPGALPVGAGLVQSLEKSSPMPQVALPTSEDRGYGRRTAAPGSDRGRPAGVSSNERYEA